MKITAFVLCCCIVAACGPQTRDSDAPQNATVAMINEVPAGAPLDDMLARMDQHLVNAMNGGMEGDAAEEFHRAEALSDRLLEARLPFEWITAEHYSVQSRLRQVQSLADRVNAELVTGAPRDQMLRDLRSLRSEVVRLRTAIARGGSRAPPSIDRLLRADSSRPPTADLSAPRAVQPDAVAAPPLGTPVTIPITTGG